MSSTWNLCSSLDLAVLSRWPAAALISAVRAFSLIISRALRLASASSAASCAAFSFALVSLPNADPRHVANIKRQIVGNRSIWPLKHSVDEESKDLAYTAREPAQPPYGFVFVPRYDVTASMGNGTVIHSEQIVDHLAFREEWVRTELSANPNNLVLISAIGDSMEPTLRAGDLLLIDRSDAGVKQDAIYAFATNGELRVKRMQLKIDGRVVVKSDNPQYEAETLTSDQVISLRIVGRVVWSGRRM